MAHPAGGAGASAGVRASLGYRLWGVVAAPVHAVVLAWALDPAHLGAWYTLSGFQRFQALVELGIGGTLLPLLAREGDPARRLGLLRLGVAWHLGMAAAWLALAPLLGGLWLRSHGVEGAGVWALTCVASAGGMLALPWLTAREAAGEIAPAYHFRLVQGVRSRLGAWAALAGGLGLWAMAAERWVALGDAALWLRRQGASGWALLRAAPSLSYAREVWPLQWRLACSTAGGALPYAVVVPAALAGVGAQEAGRLGMALALMGALQSVSWSLLAPALPGVGALLAAGEGAAARGAHARATARMLGLCGLGILGVAGGLWLFGGEVNAVMVGMEVWWVLGLGTLARMGREALAAWARADLRSPTWAVDLGEGAGCALLLPLVAPRGLMAMALVMATTGLLSLALVARSVRR